MGIVNIKTGKEMTRRDFIGGGIAAASMVSLAGSANASVRRGLGARLAANFAGGESLPYKRKLKSIITNGNQYADFRFKGFSGVETYELRSSVRDYTQDKKWFGYYYIGWYWGGQASGKLANMIMGVYQTKWRPLFTQIGTADGNVHDFLFGIGGFAVDGDRLITQTPVIFNPGGVVVDVDFCLGAMIQYGSATPIIQKAACTIERFRETNGEFDVVPVIDNNNVPCFYDDVNGVFCYNLGTGSFGYEELNGTIVDPT